jgi:light-regulated signal transduction histidine kinase (bacteriophytochrome)
MGHSIPKRDRAGTMAGWATGPNKSTAQGSPEDDWLSGVVHDLNNELTILKGRVDLLRRMADRAAVIERAQLRQNLLPVDAVTRKLIRLTGQLLDLCLLQTGRRFDLERRRSDLVALTRQIAAEQQQITERHAVCLETALESLTGWWDAARLERVLDNLLGNAAKYSPCGGPSRSVSNRRATEATVGPCSQCATPGLASRQRICRTSSNRVTGGRPSPATRRGAAWDSPSSGRSSRRMAGPSPWRAG